MLTSPSQTYWNLTKLTELILHHCEKNNIVIWAEFGSLLGLKRHNAVIPWDYDGDFGMFEKDKKYFLESFNSFIQDNNLEIILDKDYYSDSGCMAFFFKDWQDDIIDIIFYEETINTINSLQNTTTKINYPSNDDYCYNKQDFYPLNKTLMLGHLVYIPNKWDEILAISYNNWKEYPEQFKNYIDAKFLESPFIEIPKYDNINNFDELKQKIETTNIPFILSKTKFLSCDLKEYNNLIDKQKTDIYGYQSSISWSYLEEPAKKVWADYLLKKLSYNVVDSPIDDKSILPNEWNNYVKNKLNDKYDLSLTWVLSIAPKITHFHTDPSYAGGYMKLLVGEKIWWCIAPENYLYLCSKGYTIASLAKLQIIELMQLENNYLFGKIYIGVIGNDDFIWFPINTLHKVITTQDSYGFGGYL